MRKLFNILACTLFALPLFTSQALADETAPDFTLKSRDGKNIRLSELRGEVVMLNFWASWCGPCRQELPHLDALAKRYGRGGFTLLGVNVDANPEDAEKLLKEIPVSFPVLLDSSSKVSELYQVDAMPTTVIIDRNGKVRHRHKAYKPGFEDMYKDQIKELIRER